MAHSSDQKDGRGPEAYFREGDEPGFVQLTLRAKFLEAVEEVCPVALAEYQALAALSGTSELGDALKEWATRYRLNADWVIDAAERGFRLAEAGRQLRPCVGVVFSPPLSATEMTYTWWSYDGTENRERYRARHLEAFTGMLDAQIAEATDNLATDPAVRSEPLIMEPTLTNIRRAARWQTLGAEGFGHVGYHRQDRAIRNVLKRIGLKPRLGLL